MKQILLMAAAIILQSEGVDDPGSSDLESNGI
jgi:hypothetical protein